jgi:hypothetical protein
VKVSGSGGFSFQGRDCGSGIGVLVPEEWVGVRRLGPLRTERASRRRACRRCNCEEMKDAECRSPVQRVMSIRSRDWLRRVRRVVRGGRRRGCVGERERLRGGWVRRRRASVWFDCQLSFSNLGLRISRLHIYGESIMGGKTGIRENKEEGGRHTPLTILVPTLVICPLILSLLGLLITSVLPGSIGASNA